MPANLLLWTVRANLRHRGGESECEFDGTAMRRRGRDARVTDDEHRVFRRGGISYVRIPAPEPARAAAFYRDVFGWNVRGDAIEPSFDDGSGHVIGHFVADQAVAGEAGVRPYIYVENLDETLERVSANGGAIVTAPYPEGDLWVATIRDVAGNVVGMWQSGPRART